MTLMTPLIRDVCRIRFPGRMPFAPARGAKFFLVSVLLLIAVSCVAVAAPPQQSQDPSVKAVPFPKAQQSSTAASNPSPHTSTERTPLQKAVHQKK
jgi:hypothetical protein